jgi:putative NADH-flavin reductase
MSVWPAGRTHLVLVGATGMVGGCALLYALENPAVERVTAIVRRTLGISHTKLKEILHPNFGDCSALAASLSHQDAAIFCLGAYTGAVPDAELRMIAIRARQMSWMSEKITFRPRPQHFRHSQPT